MATTQTTASDFRNPVATVTTKDRELRNDGQYIVESLADDATYNLGAIERGVWALSYGQNLGLFASDGSGILIVLDGGTLFDDADTDTKMCLYVSSGDLVLKNRVGSTTSNIRLKRLF